MKHKNKKHQRYKYSYVPVKRTSKVHQPETRIFKAESDIDAVEEIERFQTEAFGSGWSIHSEKLEEGVLVKRNGDKVFRKNRLVPLAHVRQIIEKGKNNDASQD